MRLRDTINDAIERLEKAGYEPLGDVEIWNIGLQRQSDAQIRYGTQLVIEQHKFKTVRPSTIVQMIESESFKGAGKRVLDLSKLEMWKDEKGRDIMYHPDITGTICEKEWRANQKPRQS